MFDKCPIALVEEEYFPEDLLQKLDVGFDSEHMRVTYPLREIDGTLIGISGRTVNYASPRYKVYDHEYKKWDLPVHKQFKSQLLGNGTRVHPPTPHERRTTDTGARTPPSAAVTRS